MKLCRIFLIGLTLLLFTHFALAQPGGESRFKLQRLSERVLVFTENSPIQNNLVVIATSKGLIIIDTAGSPQAASELRKSVEKELGRNDFAFVINTHHHWDHSNGNSVFPEAQIIAHEECRKELIAVQPLPTPSPSPDLEQQRVGEPVVRPAIPPPRRRPNTREYAVLPPNITFSNRMSLRLEALTLKLFYFGRAHSSSDILILIPEEQVLVTGDLFFDQRWLPFFANEMELDVPLMIEVLNTILDGEYEIQYVIPGHQDLWTKDKLVLWRDYIVNLWQWVQQAKAQKLPFEDVLHRFPLDKKYEYLKALGHDAAEIQRFHERNIGVFWSQLFESAAVIVEKTILESGVEAAINKYQELKTNQPEAYFFDERQFNTVGYRLLGSGKVPAAIAVFKLNVQAYPNEWNVYDSLGEACLANADTLLAIENYKKSLELNPQNENGMRILKALETK